MEKGGEKGIPVLKNQKKLFNSHDETKNGKDDDTIIIKQTKYDFETILQQIGTFGKYQIRVYILTSLFEAPCAMAMLFFFIAGATPSWQCQNPVGFNETIHNGTSSLSANFTPFLSEGVCINDTACGDGTVVFDPSFTSAISEWELICGMQYTGTIINTILMAGVFFGALVCGQLADVLGRRRVYYVTAFLMQLSVFTSAFATSWKIFASLRFASGAFIGGVLVVGFVIPMEIIGKEWRTLCGTIGFWNVGTMALALFAYLIPNWRHCAMATGLVWLPLFLQYFVVPESPRWLIQKGRFDEAKEILKKMAKFNGKPEPDLSILHFIAEKDAEEKQNERQYSYIDLFRTKRTSINTLVMMFIWFSFTFVYYGLTINVTDLSGNRFINVFLVGFLDLPFVLSVILIAKYLGRKVAIVGYLLLGCLALVVVIIMSLTGVLVTNPLVTTALCIIGRSGISAAWAIGYLLSAELFPTVIRNIACAACSMAGRIGGLLSPQLAYSITLSPIMPYIISGAFAFVSAILVVIFLPETKGTPLPDALPKRKGFCLPDEACWGEDVEDVKITVGKTNGTKSPQATDI